MTSDRLAWRLRTAAFACLALAACITDGLVPCGDELCPIGSVCLEGLCTTSDQATACVGEPEGATCSTPTTTGYCVSGGCRASVCGDGKLEYGEVCDDGNQTSGDGCSARCDSNETCGNNVVDYAVGEQCDDGSYGLSGDGCSSTCKLELAVWREQSPLASPYARASQGMAYDSVRDRVVVFGGVRGVTGQNDTWEWDGLNWILRTPPTSPSPRASPATAYDSVHHRTVIFGGEFGPTLYNDTWLWDGTTWTQAATSTAPSPRTDTAVAFDKARGRLVLFGGRDSSGIVGDLWEWDGAAWRQIAFTGGPPARHLHVLAYDEVRARVVLVGGTDGTTNFTDTWEWDGTTWTQRTPATTMPAVRIAASATYDSDRHVVVVYSGTSGSTMPPDTDTWEWSGTDWARRTATAPKPPAVLLGGAAFDAVAHATIIFGGSTAIADNAETWALNASGWQELDHASPLPRINAGFVDEPTRGFVLMFGGLDGLTALNDTWEWDGTNWLQRVPATSPSPRRHVSLAYDASRDRVVMFGGLQNSTALGDTWQWDGSVWTQLTVAASPSPRAGHRLVYDAAHERTILFGGTDATNTVLADTWMFDGTTWTQLTPAHSPPPTTEFSFTYDPDRQVAVLWKDPTTGIWLWDGTDWTEHDNSNLPSDAVLAYHAKRHSMIAFGGDTPGATLVGETWESFDDTTWTLQTPAASPPERVDHGLAYDAARGQLLLYGGFTSQETEVGDTWTYGLESGTPPDQCEGVDTDGDGLVGCADPDCAARCAYCGDGTCELVEDYLLCPIDCAPP